MNPEEKIKALEREIELLRQIVDLQSKLIGQQHVPYYPPVYPTYPPPATTPDPWYPRIICGPSTTPVQWETYPRAYNITTTSGAKGEKTDAK